MPNLNVPNIDDIELDQVLKALGDPIRLSVIEQLLMAKGKELTCGEFEHNVATSTFSHHIKILYEAGLLCGRSEGTKCYNSLRVKEIKERFPGLLEMIKKSLGPKLSSR